MSVRTDGSSRTLEVVTIAVTALFGLYFVLLPAVAWLEGAYNVQQGGADDYPWALLAVLLAAAAPLVWWRRWTTLRRRGVGRASSWRSACMVASAVGAPLLLVRMVAGGGF